MARMIISLTHVVQGVVALFIAVLGVRIIMPFIETIIGYTWQNSLTKTGITIGVYLVIAGVFYIIVYGYLTGKRLDKHMGYTTTTQGGITQ